VYGKASKPFASFVTFLVSGIAHELVCSVAFRKPSLYFFMGMVVQVPLQVVSKYFENTRIGNIIVWVSLFLGQPLLEVRINAIKLIIAFLLSRLVCPLSQFVLLNM
jgi:acyl coA:diacylglycerol acyltransferase